MANWYGKTPYWRAVSRWSLHDLLAKDCAASGFTERARWHEERKATQAAADMGAETALEGRRLVWHPEKPVIDPAPDSKTRHVYTIKNQN